MAQFVEEGAEGVTATGISGSAPNALDIGGWLKKNRLTAHKQYFEQQEISIEDLMDFSESDMKAFWNHKDMKKLDPSPLYQSKFMKAWRKLKAQTPATTAPSTQQ